MPCRWFARSWPRRRCGGHGFALGCSRWMTRWGWAPATPRCSSPRSRCAGVRRGGGGPWGAGHANRGAHHLNPGATHRGEASRAQSPPPSARHPAVVSGCQRVPDACAPDPPKTLMQGATEVLNRTALEEAGQAPPPPNDALPPLSEAQKVASYRLSQLLYRQLPDKMQLAAREVRRHSQGEPAAVAAASSTPAHSPDVPVSILPRASAALHQSLSLTCTRLTLAQQRVSGGRKVNPDANPSLTHWARGAPQVYPTYRDYVSALAARGGVVEAVPDALLGSPQVRKKRKEGRKERKGGTAEGADRCGCTCRAPAPWCRRPTCWWTPRAAWRCSPRTKRSSWRPTGAEGRVGQGWGR